MLQQPERESNHQEIIRFSKEIIVSGVAQTQHSACINAFWAVPDLTNGALANCELDMKQMSVKLVKDTYTFNMPMIRNTCDIKMGQRLLMYKEEADEFRKKWNKEPPLSKKRQISKGKGGKGKSAKR